MFIKKNKFQKQVKKVLILRSAPDSLLAKATTFCRERYKGCDITVLVQEPFLNGARKAGADKLLLFPGNGRFTVFSGRREILKKAKDEKFNVVVVLYNNPAGHRCSNIDILGLFVSKNVWIFDSDERYFPLFGKRWLLSLVPKRFFSPLFTLLILVLLFPVLLAVYVVSKCFSGERSTTGSLTRYGG